MGRRALAARIAILACVNLLNLPAFPAQAQSPSPRERNFSFDDTTFHIGTHAMALRVVAADSLHFDFNYAYQADLTEIAREMRLDPQQLDPQEDWPELHRWHYYHDSTVRRFQHVIIPGRMSCLHGVSAASSFRAWDSYADISNEAKSSSCD